MKFHKYHGLGNDYIVIDPSENSIELDSKLVRNICKRTLGVGSDGILHGPLPCDEGFFVRIFNPDGSEAEKSGNGLRIFARYLWDTKKVSDKPFLIKTIAGMVRAEIVDPAKNIRIEIGKVSFDSADIPVLGESGDVINKRITVNEQQYTFCALTVGNPHCVIMCDEPPTPELANVVGPLIEKEKRFANRTNVQFLKVVDRQNIKIEIWERGAGYTSASGSSSVAAAAVAFKLGLCDRNINVSMPGGILKIELDDTFSAVLSGPVCATCSGKLSADLLTL